jgi:broad specificity phosphatase PhoE
MDQPLFFVMRHGETHSNDSGNYRGWSNEPEAQLSEAGKEGVRESAIFLKRTGYKFPLILCDDLDRTQETAAITADILGITQIETVPNLKPLNVGDWAGKSKKDHPIEPYLKSPDTVIPGGESHNQFDARMKKVFGDIMDLILKVKQPILIIGHGSTVSFLHNHMTETTTEVGYEGLTNPSGVLVFTVKGIIPLTKKRHPVDNPYKDGTIVSGFVTDEENRPPRECWNCRNFQRDPQTYLGECTHILVRIDPELQSRKQTNDTIAVSDKDCCDNFRNAIKIT